MVNMKRIICICLLLSIALSLVVLYGCKDGVQNGYVSEHSIIADIPLMGKQQQRILYSAYGKSDAEGQYGQVLILSDFTQDGDGLSEEQTYIAGIYNGEILTYDMGKCWPKSIAECAWQPVIFADFDGDGTSEILVNTYINGNMATAAKVLKIVDGSFEVLKDLNDDVLEKDVFAFDFIKGRKIRIYNNDIGFEYIKDISYYSDEFFDADGIGKSNDSALYCQYVTDCSVSEIGGENIIRCKRMLKLDSDLIMTVNAEYRYDSTINEIVLCGAEVSD